ncbi:MAG: penicillin-binding transpeptidase domain-containing protein [Nitrospirota bacterium]
MKHFFCKAYGALAFSTLLLFLLIPSPPIVNALPIYEKFDLVEKWQPIKKRDPFKRPGVFDDIENSGSNLSLRLNHIEQGKFVVPFQNGLKTIYTLDPSLQQAMKSFFQKNKVPYGVFIAMNPHTGKILAFVEHSSKEPHAKHLALRATYPAASIFKVVTASAALEEKQADPETLLNRFRSSDQTTLANAFARSDNSAFSDVALRYLDVKTLVRYANRFQFNQKIPFEMPVQVSRVRAEDSRNGLANLAAGFGNVGLSPLHAALIVSAIANNGAMVTPCLVDKVVTTTGKPIFECVPKVFAKAISAETAAQLKRMMGLTITEGTGRKAFKNAYREPALREITVGGKTGSLTGDNPKGKVSWFVGMAPLDHPEIVISALVVNSTSPRYWKIKSGDAAKVGFVNYFKSKSKQQIRS